ncbi:MAG: sigma 54-interacting transcriptional regulator [Lentisphaerae bacterium]|nr:sigma 54-interacting transcriptional regulator [Lentisphaerota bacterium]
MKILFLCAGGCSLGRMAEGFARSRKAKGTRVLSASTRAARLHPVAKRVMAEIGISLPDRAPAAPDRIRTADADVIVALSDEAEKDCPVLPENPPRVNWGFPDPEAIEGDEETVLAVFRNARDEIRRLVDDLFDRGYLAALAGATKSATMILDQISDGIVAHDMERKIFYFNRAAEKITGYPQEEVKGRDCHEVFSGNLCGGKCLFCDEPVPKFDVKTREMTVRTRSGEERILNTTMKSLVGSEGQPTGVLLSFRDLTRERSLARRLGEIQQFSGIIGQAPAMLEVYDLIRSVADSNVPVLIQGESGTGKELVAAAIHNESPRASKLFVPVNCGALPETLLESELFGHVKGAFTGAIRDKKGRFELADGGTIFLDEIGDISQAMQVKLMRVLQDGTFERVGSEHTVQADVRVVSATNKNLEEEIDEGRFREDLFYRLSVVPVHLPPLRERRNDLPVLLEHILAGILEQAGRGPVKVSPQALDVMLSHSWPGNVRELQNWIQFALIKCRTGDEILPQHLPPQSRTVAGPSVRKRRQKLSVESVRQALHSTNGNKVEAARVLGVSRATLYRFLEQAEEL